MTFDSGDKLTSRDEIQDVPQFTETQSNFQHEGNYYHQPEQQWFVNFFLPSNNLTHCNDEKVWNKIWTNVHSRSFLPKHRTKCFVVNFQQNRQNGQFNVHSFAENSSVAQFRNPLGLFAQRKTWGNLFSLLLQSILFVCVGNDPHSFASAS